MALFGLGGNLVSKEELKKKLSSDPSDLATAVALAVLLADTDRAEAIAVLSRVAAVLERKGKLLDAIAVLAKAEQVDPDRRVNATVFAQMDLRRLQKQVAKADAAETSPAPESMPEAAPPVPQPPPISPSGMLRRKGEQRAMIAAIPLLRDVPHFLVEPLFERTCLRSFGAGERVLIEGSAGDSLLFLVSGQVAVGAMDDSGKVVPLAAFRPGDVLGVVSFLSRGPREATAKAIGTAMLLEMTREQAEMIIDRYKRFKEKLETMQRERVLVGVLAKARLFRSLTREQRDKVGGHLMPLTAKPGDRVIQEGATDGMAYILNRGECQVTAARAGQEIVLATLRPHEVFGDVAALLGGPRTASVTAITPLEFYCLSRPDLEAILAEYPFVRTELDAIQLERRASNAKILSM